jgi:hypothetical protein
LSRSRRVEQDLPLLAVILVVVLRRYGGFPQTVPESVGPRQSPAPSACRELIRAARVGGISRWGLKAIGLHDTNRVDAGEDEVVVVGRSRNPVFLMHASD